LPQSSNATLIIVLRHKDHIYVASDSVLSRARKKSAEEYIKCFPASDTSCVAISGFGGADGTISTISNQITFDLRFPQTLDRIASEEYAKHLPFTHNLTNILDSFSSTYRSLMSIVETNGYTNHEQFDETDIYYIGYDPESARFSKFTARFSPNAPHSFDLRTDSIPESTINFMGEYGFLLALMWGNDSRLKQLKSETLTKALSPPLTADTDLEAKTICGGILQLYALHTKYSKHFEYDDGLVGPPYVVYRVTTNSVTRIYYGRGLVNDDERVLGVLLCAIMIVLLVGILIFVLKA
jgi:hypothetical protein